MRKEELLEQLIINYGPNALDSYPNTKLVSNMIDMMINETPAYSFALREDLKNEKQFLPARGEPKASGWDVRAAMKDRKPLIIKPFQHIKIPLGIRSMCPAGWWYELRPRSSTFAKKNLHSLYGVIDELWEGELCFAAQFLPDGGAIKRYLSCFFFNKEDALTINFGDAIGQLIPIRRQEMKVVEMTNEEYDIVCKERNGARGTNGWGSTGV
jgi:dUTPase